MGQKPRHELTIDDEGAGLQIDTKFGTFNITKSKNTQSFSVLTLVKQKIQ
jgi:hypothetical protein